MISQSSYLLVVVLLSSCLAKNDEGVESNDRSTHVYEGRPMARYWRGTDGSVHKSDYGRELQPDVQGGPIYPDKVQVVSSSLKILPRKITRQKRSPWRIPREYQFVTREFSSSGHELNKNSGTRTARLIDGRRPYNYYPEDRMNYPQDDFYRGRYQGPNRRIIYYATLPEVVRRPGEWTPPRPIYNPDTGYPPIRENEITRVQSPIIDVTRVHSSLIDVSDKDRYQKPSIEVHAPNLSTPKFTIIDAEPPYDRPSAPSRYDDRHLEQERYDRNRYSNYGSFNRYDYDRYLVDPYRPYIEDRRPRPSYLHQSLPAQPVTIYRKPLDVRPLDPTRDLTTSTPTTTYKSSSPSSSSSSSSSSAASTTMDPISQFERTLRFRS